MTRMNANRFASALHRALNDSHISVVTLSERLRKSGHPVSHTTLLSWRTGKTLPRRQSSLAAIWHIEKILALPKNTLLVALQNDIRDQEIFSDSPQYNTESEMHTSRLDSVIDWKNEGFRELVEEHIIISADRRRVVQRVGNLLRIPNTQTPSLHVSTFWTDDDEMPDANDIGIYDIQGATVENIYSFDDDTIKIAQLTFPPPPTQLHYVSYTHSFRLKTPTNETSERIFSYPINYYTCSVVFEGECPATIDWVFTHTNRNNLDSQHLISTRRLTPIDNSIQITLENVKLATSVLRWQ